VRRRRVRLARARRAAGYTQESLAELLGLDRSTVVRWERAETEPQPWIRARLASALAVSPLELDGLLHDLGGPIEANQGQNDHGATSKPESVLDIASAWSPGNMRARLQGLTGRPALAPNLPLAASAMTSDQADELAVHLLEQWHVLVRADNLFGPRYALDGVLLHLRLVNDALDAGVPAGARPVFVQLEARFAESAAWLSEDSGDLVAARWYNRIAMACANEVDDKQLQAWTLFRASQLAAHRADSAAMVRLSRAAGRHEPELPAPMRAAILQQEAQGHALVGDSTRAQVLFDQAHRWASIDTTGAARAGHGAFCTPTYIELQRAASLERLGRPTAAVELFERTLPTLPVSYRRDRGVALSQLASAHYGAGDPERSAITAREALHIAVGAGSVRTVNRIRTVARILAGHRQLQPVAELLGCLDHLAVS
jgi:transcriptional regulator with XRE-family HTH domain